MMKGKELIKYIIDNNLFDNDFDISKEDLDNSKFINKNVLLFDVHGNVKLKGILTELDDEYFTIKSKSYPNGCCHNRSVYSIQVIE